MVNHDIVWLDISMRYSHAVTVIQSLKQNIPWNDWSFNLINTVKYHKKKVANNDAQYLKAMYYEL